MQVADFVRFSLSANEEWIKLPVYAVMKRDNNSSDRLRELS